MLAADPDDKPFTYFKADIMVDGVAIPSVGIRKKGFYGSLDEVRPSLKIKFDEYTEQEPIQGLNRLTLNNNKQDASQMSQLLAYRIFNDAGVAAPRCSLAKVTVNGEYLGIYSNVESIKKPFLQDRFGRQIGQLYEGTVVDFHPQALGKLEAKNDKAEESLHKVERLAELLATEGELPIDQVGALVDLDQFLKFWAVESLLGFWDGYTQDQNNFFVYEDSATGKFCFIPWGADVCFTTGGGPLAGVGGGGDRSEAIYAQAILPNRLYHTPGMPDRYKEAMLQVLEDAWNEKSLLAEVDRIQRLTDGHLHETQIQSARGSGWGIQALTPDRVREFIRQRRDTILAELDSGPLKIAGAPRVPMHTEELGTASGTFETRWSEGFAPGGPAGQLQMTLMREGEEVKLAELSATGHVLQAPSFPGFGGGENRTSPAMLVLKATRVNDRKPVVVTLMVDRASIQSTPNQRIPVSGTFVEGNPGFGFGFGGPMLSGTIELTDGGTESGDAIAGDFDVRIVKIRGGGME